MTSGTAVSVCIPVHQGAEYIGRAVESVLAQTLTDFELVVRDNGSTDGTADIVSSFDDPRIRLERIRSVVPLPENWNRAVGLCRAPLVKLLCADDVLRPTCLELQVAALRAGVVAVAGRVDMIDSRDRVMFANRHLSGLLGTLGMDEVVRAVVRHGGNPIGAPPSVLFRRAAFDAIGGFDGTNPFVMDLDCWIRLLDHGRLHGHRETVAGFRIHPGSVSAAASRQEFTVQRRHTRALVRSAPSVVRRRDVVVGIAGAYSALARRLALFMLGAIRARTYRGPTILAPPRSTAGPGLAAPAPTRDSDRSPG